MPATQMPCTVLLDRREIRVFAVILVVAMNVASCCRKTYNEKTPKRFPKRNP